jgi:hypothetical protein
VGGTVPPGWHSDPFGVHEARYFSADGQPTKLVRDRGAESYDEPPSGADEVAAAVARMSAMPEPPSAYAYGDAYPYDRAPERGSWRPSIGRFAVTWMIAVAAAVAIVLVAQVMLRAPKPAGTPGTPGASGASDASGVAFVTQAATRTLQQRTVDLVMSATSSMAGGTSTALHGTGAVDLSGKAGTLSWTMKSGASVTAVQEIIVNRYVYMAMSVNGVDLMPKDKPWLAQQVLTQGAGTTGIFGLDPTAELASLESHGITVRALGTKVIGGVNCTGYAVTPPGAPSTITVWIDAQHLVREFTADMTITISADLSVAGTSPSASPVGTPVTGSLDMTMDFSYSAAPVHVTAPPAASTISFDDWINQLGQNPALKRLEPTATATAVR